MELHSSAWQLITALMVFLAGVIISVRAGRRFQTKIRRILIIYSWHTLLCLTYNWYALTYGADAIAYYRKAIEGVREFSFGTAAVEHLTALFVQGLGLSLLGTFLVFNIFGTIGLLAFDAALRIATLDTSRSIQRFATLIIFLPSISFWSSALGKDAISFMATGLALWAALNLSRRVLLMTFSIAAMLIVRPHMAGLMLMALTLAFILDSETRMDFKIILGGIAAGMSALLVPFALKYAGVGDVINEDSLTTYVEVRQSYNMAGGGGVDIANMILPMKLFTYMFRPIIFEARSVFSLAASIDNIILLYLFIAGGRRLLLVKDKSIYRENRAFMWLYSIMAWLVLALTTANLGIALRQKWMFTPMLIFLFISVIGRKRVATESTTPLSVPNVITQNNIPGPPH